MAKPTQWSTKPSGEAAVALLEVESARPAEEVAKPTLLPLELPKRLSHPRIQLSHLEHPLLHRRKMWSPQVMTRLLSINCKLKIFQWMTMSLQFQKILGAGEISPTRAKVD
jgi:hypothetical protein